MAMKLWLNYTHGNSSPQHSNSLEIAGVWFCVLFKGSSWGRWFVVWIYSQPGFELNLGSGFYLLFLEQITLTCWTKVSPSITREELNYHGFKIRVLGSINQPLALCTMYDQKMGSSPEVPKGPSAQAAVSRQEGRDGGTTGVMGSADGEVRMRDVKPRWSDNQSTEPGYGGLRSEDDSQVQRGCPPQR